MNPDDLMAAELGAAGKRWRAANGTASAAVDFDAISPTRAGRATKWAVVLSAAVVVAALAGGTAWLTSRPGHSTHAVHGGPVVPDAVPALTGITWHLTQATNAFGSFRATAASGVTLNFAADGAVLGTDGINTFSGPSDLGSGSIQFGQLASTAIGSTSPPAQQLAHIVQSILQGKVTWTVSGPSPQLVIIRPGVGTLRYAPEEPAKAVTDPTKLPGTWKVTELDHTTDSAASETPVNFHETLTIVANGTFTVQFRCYTNAGKVMIDPGVLTWSSVHLASSIPCPSAATQQAEQDANDFVVSVLTGETQWWIANGDLTITNNFDAITLTPTS